VRTGTRDIAARDFAVSLKRANLPILKASPGHTFSFIARLTGAYLNFEVKDGAPISAVAEMGINDRNRAGPISKRRRLRRARSLTSKFRCAFRPPSDELVFPRHARREKRPALRHPRAN
jgi:hypothetical protein